MTRLSRSIWLAASLTLITIPLMAEEQAAPAAPAGPQVPGVEELLKSAEASMAKINDYTGQMHKQEHFLDEMGKVEKMAFKFARPFKVYVKYLNVYNGREAIFKRGWNDNEVKVHKGTFPDITVNLDPQGDTAMEGNHHPVTDFGLESTIRISARNLRKALKKGDGEFKVTDGGTLNGRPCWKIEAKLPKGGYFTTAKDDETLWDIAKRTGQDMYLIMFTNKDKFDEPDDPDEGDKVFIPNYYGGRSEMYLDKENFMPIQATTYDWAGKLYETYSYHDLKYNVGLKPKDFDPDNKDYNF